MRFLLSLITSLLLVGSFQLQAEEIPFEKIKISLQQIDEDLTPTQISQSPIPGLYQVIIGAEVLYVTADAEYIVQGEIFAIKDKQNIQNLTENSEESARSSVLSSIPPTEYIEFAPAKTEKTIYVFTDITCGYCRKLHQDVPELNDNGIAVRYLAYPRGGTETTGAFELSAVWCSDDRNQAMTDAKLGETIEIAECDNPVSKHYQLGNSFGVTGTPAIFLENGFRVPGYLPPARLLPMIEKESS